MSQKTKVMRRVVGRRNAVVLAIGVVVGLAAVPTGAQAGFFEQLFGGFQAPAPQVEPSTSYDSAPRVANSPLQSRHIHRHVAKLNDKPVLQKTTGLMEDKTLRSGDAVMMKDGLHVYAGPTSATHETDQFVALDDARHLTGKERVELASMDTMRNDPLATDKTDTIASGRSAAIGSPIVTGYRITDGKGASIRYVGP